MYLQRRWLFVNAIVLNRIDNATEVAHPGATVEITEGTWSGQDTTFSGFFAAEEGPDIINLVSEMNTLYGESLADMDPTQGRLPGQRSPILGQRWKMPNMMARQVDC